MMKVKKLILGMLSSSLALPASALMVGVDFNQPNANYNMQGSMDGMGKRWNAIEISCTDPIWKDLKDAEGNSTKVSFAIMGSLRGYAHNRSAHDLLRDYIVSEGGYEWALSGLEPGTAYRIYGYGLDVNSGVSTIRSGSAELAIQGGLAKDGEFLEVTADDNGVVNGSADGTWAGFILATPAAVLESQQRILEPQGVFELKSPSGALQADLQLNEFGGAEMRVLLNGNLLFDWSSLGLVFDGMEFIDTLVAGTPSAVTPVEESYTLINDKQSSVEAKGNEQSVRFTNANGESFQVVLRVYDDGVAIRYQLPEDLEGAYEIIEELTAFRPAAEANVYASPYDRPGAFSPAYETIITEANSAEVFFPVLLQMEHGSVLVTEAGLERGNYGSHLGQMGSLWKLMLPLKDENPADSPRGAVVGGGWQSPWRVLLVGKTPGDLIESTLVTTLSAPSKIEDPSWIKPGVSSWSWWSDGSSPKDPAKLKEFIDLAADMGWEYSLVDANWSRDEVEDLVTYAGNKGVKLFYWYNSGGDHNSVSEQPRDLMVDREIRRKEMAWLQESGIAGIKVDFFNSDKVERIAQYLDILEDAADFQLLVNYHGSTLPRGWNRTWPNLMTMESVKGGEAYKFKKEPWNTLAGPHNVNVVFTRNIVGAMDYTPGVLTRNSPTGKIQNTAAHELALGVVFQSGILHWCDTTDAYLKQPERVQDFLKALPAVWDETRFVAGEPGEFVVLARRQGSKWFIGGINGSEENVTVEIPWEKFSTDSQPFTVLSDGSGGDAIIPLEDVPASITIMPRGGFVAW